MITGAMLCLTGIAVLALILPVSAVIPGQSNLPSPPWRGNCQKNFPDTCTGNTFCGAPGNCLNGNCQYKCYYCDCADMTQCYFNDQNQIKCDCTGSGATGAFCETDIDECEAEPCQNGGTCVNGINGYTCCCPDGFSGTDCEDDIRCNPNPCENGGTCCTICDDVPNALTCTCPAGYRGPTCNIDIDDCCPNPCQNGGSCDDGVDTYTCSCASGFQGVNCETNTYGCTPNPFQNGVACTDSPDRYTCTCDSCQTANACNPNPCLNGGSCFLFGSQFRCACVGSYLGSTCQFMNGC